MTWLWCYLSFNAGLLVGLALKLGFSQEGGDASGPPLAENGPSGKPSHKLKPDSVQGGTDPGGI